MDEKIAILGAGPGGYVAAVRAAQLGAKVTVVEKDNVGGTCLNWGCIPSKIMKTTADLLDKCKKGMEYGITAAETAAPDMNLLMAKKQKVINIQIKGIENLLSHHKISLIKGNGVISGPHSLTVTTRDQEKIDVRWDKLIIATGSEPMNIPAFPFDKERIISSNEALSLTRVPESIVIVGGGVIGCEFASILSSMGAKVTIVEALDRILPIPSLDPDCSKVLAREMKKRKIKCFVNRVVEKVENHENGLSVITGPSPFAENLKDKDKNPLTIESQMVLVCIGRSPNTTGIGLENIRLSTNDKGWLETDLHMQTAQPDVYAIGDVLGPEKVMLAHVASAEGIVAAENVMGEEKTMNYEAIPGAIFTSPEVACVGITEEMAKSKGLEVRADTTLFRTIGKAQAIGEPAGQVKIVSDTKNGQVLGVHLIGPHVTDLVAEGTLAIQNNLSVKDVADTIHAHPTLAEIMFETSLKAMDISLHG